MTPAREPVRAEDIAASLTDQEPEEPIYILRDARVEGELDLSHRTVLIAVDIQNCEFSEDVDFTYCEFTQYVNLSTCTFVGDFNRVDEAGANTIYRKNLVCDGATFQKDAGFNGCQIEGSAYFTEATFKGVADFRWMKCTTLTCNGATFGGPANFNTLKCESSGLFTWKRAGCRPPSLRWPGTARPGYAAKGHRDAVGENSSRPSARVGVICCKLGPKAWIPRLGRSR